MSRDLDETHDAALTSWVESANSHGDFPIQNLPLGVFSRPGDARPRIGVAIGDEILDLGSMARDLPATVVEAVAQPTLNALLGLVASDRVALRRRLSTLLSDPRRRDQVAPSLVPAADCTLHLPAAIGDYTDFYVGIHHATNVGKLLRPDNPLLPNYKHVPIGYHGRASSIRPSGTPVIRPRGQRKEPDAAAPDHGLSQRLDYELELGVWIGQGNDLGQPIGVAQAREHIAGFCLLNDWSARDFQAWEYQPLGPFLAKNFMSTISPWVVTAEAMAPFRIAQPPRPAGDPRPLPYLWDEADQRDGALSVDLSVFLSTARMREAGVAPLQLSQGPTANMYWTVAQLVAHHTVNGCNLRPGDLLGTGTISAPGRDGLGSLMEISEGGNQRFALGNGETRGFLEDGDEILLAARAHAPGRISIGFGSCRGVVVGRPEPRLGC
jgi:fumarylacetoacetase